MREVCLPDGSTLPALGLGTWRLGESRGRRARDVAAVRHALELGYRLIDTAEMYGDGGAEEVVGQAIAQAVRAGDVRREELFVVSKVYPHHASRSGTPAACDRSRRRLGLDRIDLYLLHWRGAVPLQETVESLRALVGTGAVARWGVSNFDVADLDELDRLAGGAADCATDQVWYSLGERGAEHSLLPRLRARGVPLMAYSPVDQGRRALDERLQALAAPLGLEAAQLALAWVIAQEGVVAIPKASAPAHQKANLAAADLVLDEALRARLQALFPPPRGHAALAMN